MKKAIVLSAVVLLMSPILCFLSFAMNDFPLFLKKPMINFPTRKENRTGFPIAMVERTFFNRGPQKAVAYEIYSDIDNDGVQEKLVLESSQVSWGRGRGQYNRLLIYRIGYKNEELVFDSVKAGINDFRGVHIGKNQWIRIADEDQDGSPEIYIRERALAKTPGRLGIIEKVNDQFSVVFFGYLDDYGYKEFDHHLVLYGKTSLDGKGRFNTASWTAFDKQDSQYVTSYQYTLQVIKMKMAEDSESFKNGPQFVTASEEIGLAILGGYTEKLKSFVKNNRDFLSKIKYHHRPLLTQKELADPDTLVLHLQTMLAKTMVWRKTLNQAEAVSAGDLGAEQVLIYGYNQDGIKVMLFSGTNIHGYLRFFLQDPLNMKELFDYKDVMKDGTGKYQLQFNCGDASKKAELKKDIITGQLQFDPSFDFSVDIEVSKNSGMRSSNFDFGDSVMMSGKFGPIKKEKEFQAISVTYDKTGKFSSATSIDSQGKFEYISMWLREYLNKNDNGINDEKMVRDGI
ncbi:MAG TPA: hypothetical protein DDW50_07095 [Firmicutes bacterium]|jgi:hypothetical protein|nr:hypothetical protein [Bacillota bacterium]